MVLFALHQPRGRINVGIKKLIILELEWKNEDPRKQIILYTNHLQLNVIFLIIKLNKQKRSKIN